ncbi:hypothetical protein KJ853_00705 [Patescibacteria group bacterium]|nr:hypothetical protein [Patescibacteria group bacterium]
MLQALIEAFIPALQKKKNFIYPVRNYQRIYYLIKASYFQNKFSCENKLFNNF